MSTFREEHRAQAPSANRAPPPSPSLAIRYDGTRPESTGLSAGTEPRRVQPVRHNKTADTSFLQNQPVTARGINNKNLQPVAARGINNKNFRRRRPPSVRRQNVRVTSRRAASCCCRVFP